MKIKSIKIEKLYGKYDFDWDLRSDVNIIAGDNGSYKTRKSSMTKEEFFDDEMNSQRTERNLDKYCHYTGRGFKSYNELTLHDEKITENQYSLEDKKRPYEYRLFLLKSFFYCF